MRNTTDNYLVQTQRYTDTNRDETEITTQHYVSEGSAIYACNEEAQWETTIRCRVIAPKSSNVVHSATGSFQ